MTKKKGQISAFEAKETKKETKNKKNSRMRLVMFAVILMAAAYFVMSGIQIIQLNQEMKEAEERQQQLLNTKEDLTAEYENISSEKYIERIARRDLKLVRGNELLFILPETSDSQKTGPVYDDGAGQGEGEGDEKTGAQAGEGDGAEAGAQAGEGGDDTQTDAQTGAEAEAADETEDGKTED